jgi:hypothetical protein
MSSMDSLELNGIKRNQCRDEDYEIGIERVPLDGFEAAIADGRLNDARVVAGLYLARGFLAAQAALA